VGPVTLNIVKKSFRQGPGEQTIEPGAPPPKGGVSGGQAVLKAAPISCVAPEIVTPVIEHDCAPVPQGGNTPAVETKKLYVDPAGKIEALAQSAIEKLPAGGAARPVPPIVCRGARGNGPPAAEI
jgi:hypothetical protein